MKRKVRKKIPAVMIAFFYSVAYTVIGPMTEEQDFDLHPSRVLLPFMICLCVCTAVNLFLFSVFPRLHFGAGRGKIARCMDRSGDRRLFLLVWIFIFAAWIPAYLILFPGVLSYDILSQTMSALGTISSNHHPVLHTWLIRIFMNLGKSLFGAYEYGIGLLSLLQMLLLSYALTRVVMLLKKRRVPESVVLVTAVLSAVWFMNACLAVTVIKDTLHAAFLVLFACHFTELVTDPSAYCRQKKNLIFLPVVSFLMCAFRNNGIYIYLFCFACLTVLRLPAIIRQIGKLKRFLPLAAVILLPIFLYRIYTGPVFEALHIQQGEVREALSVPIQQLQRVAVNRAGELTEEQTGRMNYYITDLAWREWSPGREYDPFFADPAKSCFVSGSYNSDPAAFWKFYLQIGKQFSKEYLAAFLSNTAGLWYPGEYRFSYVAYDNYAPEKFEEPLERRSIASLTLLENCYESFCQSDLWRELPGVRLFFVQGFTLWILIYIPVLAWKKKFFTESLPLFLPLIGQFGIMLLSPMASFRYAWPFYLLLPLALTEIFREPAEQTEGQGLPVEQEQTEEQIVSQEEA